MTEDLYNKLCFKCNNRTWTSPLRWDGYIDVELCSPCTDLKNKSSPQYLRAKHAKMAEELKRKYIEAMV